MHECDFFTCHLRFGSLGDFRNVNFSPEHSCVGLQSEMCVGDKITSASTERSVRATVSDFFTFSIL